MSETAIVLLAPVAATGDALATPLREAGHQVAVFADMDAALGAVSGRSLLIVSGLSDDAASAACHRVRGTPLLREAGICVLTASTDVEARVALIEAGADEVVPESIDPRELEARLGALLVRSTRGAVAVPATGGPPKRPNRSIAVVSPTGGVGTTTIAVNLALALPARQQGRIAVADLHLPFGQVASYLDVPAQRTVVDLAADDTALTDPSLIVTYAERHDSGLAVYAAPTAWDPTAILTPQMAAAFVETATLAHDRVVIDLGSAFDDRMVAVLARAEIAVVPVRPEVPSLRAVSSFVSALIAREVDPAKILFVVNEMARGHLKAQELETALGRAPAAELPYDATLYARAANQGIPLMTSAPESAPATAFARIAAIVMGDVEAPAAALSAPSGEKRSSGLFGGLFGNRG